MDSEGKQEVYYEQRTVNGREIFHFTFEKVVINNETASLMGMRGLLMYEKIKRIRIIRHTYLLRSLF